MHIVLRITPVLLFVTGFFTFSSPLSAQDTLRVWNLQDCIDYALENNITLQKSLLSYEESVVDLKTAKATLFPSLSFSTSHNLTNRPFEENSTNLIEIGNGNYTTTNTNNKTSYSGSYGLNASWTVYNGNRRLKNIEQQKLVNEVSELNVEQTENELIETITQTYIQILYAAESVKVNESTLALSAAQRDRAKELLEVGLIALSDYAQLEAQYSNDKYQLVTAEATLRTYKLQLKQLLELDEESDIVLEMPEIDREDVLTPLPDKMDVYYTALTFRPEIQSSRINMDISQLNIAIARAAYFPTISLNAGTATSSSSGSDRAFGSQLKYRWNNTVGVSLSVPILNNRQTKSAVEKAILQSYSSELDSTNQQKELYRTIAALWRDANYAQERYVAALESYESSLLSYDLVNEQFTVGLRNTIELLTEKNNLLSAQQAALQAKYMAILSIQLLRFYQGESIVL
ncbi:MAG: TolC family protein [Bacteroides sp.]|nr:TolC family protein [Bacteroides sp.]